MSQNGDGADFVNRDEHIGEDRSENGKGKGKGNGKSSSKGKSSTKAGAGANSTAYPCCMKFLTPEILASALIGKNGGVIQAMRQECDARIGLTDKGSFFPQTDCRVMTVQATSEDSLNEVSRQIIAKAVEVTQPAGSGGGGESAESPDITIKALVPKAAVGGFIGKAGATIKRIRETTGAKIVVSQVHNVGTGPGAGQTITVEGSANAVEPVLKEVNQQIQLLGNEAWFQSWTLYTGIPGSGSGTSATTSYVGQNASIDTMIRVAQTLPPYVMEDSRGFAVSCVVPNRLVGGLIGRGGTGTKEIQNQTGTRIGIREIPDDPEHRSLNISGSLANTCTAYMLMMKRYLDAESQATPSSPENSPAR